MKKIQLTAFFIIVFSSFASIMLINFGIDPYRVFRTGSEIDLHAILPKHADVILKAYKNLKYDTVFIGGSSFDNLFNYFSNFYSLFFASLSMHTFSYKDYYYVLKAYLKLHPETKKVYIFLSNTNCLDTFSNNLSDFHVSNNFNVNDLFFLLCSIDTLKKSIAEYKAGKPFELRINMDSKISMPLKINDFKFDFFPYTISGYFEDKDLLNKIYQNNAEYLKKTINLLKKKNIDYTFIIPPYHALYYALILRCPCKFPYKAVENQKRLAVSLSNGSVYDFSIINKYTASDIFNNNYYWEDLQHGNFILGFKIFKALKGSISEDGLYKELNKDNIDLELKNQRKKLKEYIKNNEKLVLQIESYKRNNNSPKHLSYRIPIDLKDAAEFIQEELNWIREQYKKVNKLLNTNKRAVKKRSFAMNI